MDISEKAVPKCPVCGEPLSIEGVAIGKEKNSDKRVPKIGASIMQATGYALESAVLAIFSSGRAPMWVCNNSNCLENGKKFSVRGPNVSDKIPNAQRRFDIGGIGVGLDKAIYNMMNKRKK